ncbi:heterokaryon incompatibility protein het-E-1 [Fusarium sp. NRRL 52700]|nr:heterokaryon incompatibility protein het-E-1 [Fusarium sp. NRRL 52700]
MSTNHQTSFEKSLDSFRRELSDDQIKQMDGVNRKTLNDTIQATQNILGRRNDLCKLTRIQRFLHAMEHIEKLVTIFLNASDFVAFVWGPIKLALMVATTWTDAIRQLIDAYEEIAEALGNLAFFHTLIQSRDHLKLVLEDYFSDILRFHRCVLDVFSRPEWKRIFKWAWGSFRREVKPILESLKRKQALLSDDKLQSHAILKEVQDSDQYAKDQFSTLQTSLEDIRSTLDSQQFQSKTLQAQEMKSYLESRLDVSKPRSDLQLESRDPILENSGNWILSDPTFESWERGNSQDRRVLFLNGSPGSGKTTLAKTIIRHQKRKQASQSPGRSFLTYFFFKHDAADRRTTRSMLQHIIMQLVNTDETIMRFAYERLSTMESTELPDLKKLASDSMTSRPTATLVLDGLDEAMDNEPEISISWCLNELLTRDGRLDVLLLSHAQIRLDMVDAHQNDIEQFTKGQAAKIRARFQLTEQEETKLISKISTTSQGMFLYAKVVLDNLAMMDSIQEFEDELEADTFPEDLDQAYERIAQRILKRHGPSRQKTVKKILGWVICATRPLRWREIQSRFCVDADKVTCNIRNLRRDGCKSICSSLVDVTSCDLFPSVESEQAVSMVHETATKYLIRNGTVNLLEEHIDMALFCCRYLSSRPFTTGKHQNISADIQSGYFGFLDYAAAHYAVHIQEVEASEAYTDPAPGLEAVKDAAVNLAKANCKEISVQKGEIYKTSEVLDLTIQDNVLVVRTLISLQREKSETAIFDATEGPIRHKCHKIRCSKFATGCFSESALKDHLAVHERPFRCPHIDCFAHTVGYASSQRLESHNEAFHQSESRAKAVFSSDLETGEWNLYEACKAGNLDEVKRFHREGADLRSRRTKISSPLCTAAEAGHGDICQYLVENGVDPYHVGSHGITTRTPVIVAMYRERREILEFFLHSGNGPSDSELAETIAGAIHANQPAALNMLLAIKQPVDHASIIRLVLEELISQTDLRTVRRDAHPVNTTLVHTWFQYVKPEFYNEKGVFIAQSDCAEYKIWGDIFFRDLNFFHKALQRKCFYLATFLMDIGHDDYIQIKSRDGDTPLHCCIKGMCRGNCSSCMSMVRRLLQFDNGKLANILDSDGRLPAHTALRSLYWKDGLRAILDNTRDINHRDNSGQSLLHVAESSYQIRVLVENKSVDLFSRNNKGQTAVSAFIDRPFVISVEALDQFFKAEPRLAWTPDKSEEGLTPLHYGLKHLGSGKLDYFNSQTSGRKVKLLLTCSEVKRVLVEFQAKSTDADRRRLRDFAREEMLREALDIMDSIGFIPT